MCVASPRARMWRSAGVTHCVCPAAEPLCHAIRSHSLPCSCFAHSYLSDLLEPPPDVLCGGRYCVPIGCLKPRTRVPHTSSFCNAAGTHSRCMTAVCPPAENTRRYIVCDTHRTSSLFLPALFPPVSPAGTALSRFVAAPFVLAGVETFYPTDSVVQRERLFLHPQ